MPVNYFKALCSAIVGVMRNIGMKTIVMYLGISFYPALQILIVSDKDLSRLFSSWLMSQ
jgi:hypothetical protein